MLFKDSNHIVVMRFITDLNATYIKVPTNSAFFICCPPKTLGPFLGL